MYLERERERIRETNRQPKRTEESQRPFNTPISLHAPMISFGSAGHSSTSCRYYIKRNQDENQDAPFILVHIIPVYNRRTVAARCRPSTGCRTRNGRVYTHRAHFRRPNDPFPVLIELSTRHVHYCVVLYTPHL